MSASPLPRRVYVAVALLSLSVLMLQIALNRVFSYTSWHHLAYISVSLALLGFGASGSVLAAFPRLAGSNLGAGLATHSALASLGTGAALLVLGALPLNLGDVVERPVEALKLVVTLGVVSIPFFFTGLAIALALREAGDRVGRLYFFDLVGAGLGCALVVQLLDAFETPKVLVGIALLFAVSGLIAAGSLRGAVGRANLALAAFAALAVLAPLPSLLSFAPSRDKLIAPWLESETLHYSRWGALFRTDLVGAAEGEASEGGYRAHGVSPDFDGPSPEFRLIFHDGTAGALLYRVTGRPGEFAMFEHHVLGAPYRLLDRPEVLVVGVGGGADVVNALTHGARRVVGAELDPLTVDLIRNQFADYTNDLFNRPEVTIHNREGRSLVRSTDERFDLIQLTGVDTLAALSSGAYIFAENYLYTVQAFEDFFRILREGGVLSVAAADFAPSHGYARHGLRFASLAYEALRARGIAQPHRHIMVISEARGIAQFEVLTKLEPFSAEEVARIERYIDGERLVAWYLPGRPRRQEPSFRTLLEAPDAERAAFLRQTFLDLRPTTDDRPFFFSFYKWRNLFEHRAEIDPGHLLATGQLVLALIFGLSILFSVVAIVLPLLRGAAASAMPGRWPFLGYFAALGTGFIFAEICFVQRFVLFLGYPLYSLSVILFSFLTAAGIGASFSGRLPDRPERVLPTLALVLTAIVGLYLVVTPRLFGALLGASLAARCIATVAICAPLGVVLGLFFPYGVRLTAARQRDFTSWAWAVNGCFTVVGSVLSVILATSFGFETVTLLFVAIYWLGVASFLLGQRRAEAADA